MENPVKMDDAWGYPFGLGNPLVGASNFKNYGLWMFMVDTYSQHDFLRVVCRATF